MIITNNIFEAKFIERPNRFIAHVNLNGEILKVHVPNTGRCKEIFIKDVEVHLREELNPNRKTKYDLIALYKDKNLINIDSQIPNKVVEEALNLKMIDKLSEYDGIKREVTYKKSRFDFKLTNKDKEYYLEVKGVTLEENGHSMFPDAPTERGTKHIYELIEAKKEGFGAGIIFLIQMGNIHSFSPNYKTDKNFSDALKIANSLGVDIFAYDCVVTKNSITLNKKINIIL